MYIDIDIYIYVCMYIELSGECLINSLVNRY